MQKKRLKAVAASLIDEEPKWMAGGKEGKVGNKRDAKAVSKTAQKLKNTVGQDGGVTEITYDDLL